MVPGCSYIYADMSAPDLFNWFNAEIMNFEGVDNQQIDNRFWKITYQIQREYAPQELDEEMEELLGGQVTEARIDFTELTAEILKIQDEAND